MKIEKTFLRSKVAQRIALLFITCALLPIIILAILSFIQVNSYLSEQSKTRLSQTSKTYAMAVYERLLFLDADMVRMASKIHDVAQDASFFSSSIIDEYQKNRFKSLAIISDTETSIPIFGSISHVPNYSPEEKRLIHTGETYLTFNIQKNHPPQIFLSIGVNSNSSDKSILLAEVDPFYLWYMRFEDSLPAMTEFFVLDHNGNVLFTTLKSTSLPLTPFSKEVEDSSSGQFEWNYESENYLACYRNIFMQPKFQVPHWTVVTTETKKYIRSPIANFQKTFILVILLSLWIVLFLSLSQIRHSLIPLEKLKAATKRLAKKDFDAKLTITTKDEFADVAKTFNAMVSQLERQFKTLTTIAEIDRAILSSFETEEIANMLLKCMSDVFPCKSAGITLLNPDKPNAAQIFTWNNNSMRQTSLEGVALDPSDAKSLLEHKENLFIELRNSAPNYLAPLERDGNKFFSVFPIFLENTLEAIVSLGFDTKPNLTEEELAQARQLCDQMGIGLTNARLIEELSDFNLGTLRALARTIDAKSPWTGGHSERVTKYGLEIGKAMGFAVEELEILQRGGLLHDIGKIGISNKILDKPGKLTEEERTLIQDHPRLGVRILEPIGAFTDVLRIVLQHHENFDGTGYPEGLVGEEISIYSRIFAVSDRYEALTADRPYRKAFSPLEAAKFIRDNSGTQFDPIVVDVFLSLLAKKKKSHLIAKDNLSTEFSSWSPK
jgi:putative nucleotidyltransferase with HDIG domain